MKTQQLFGLLITIAISANAQANSFLPKPVTDNDYYVPASSAVIKLGQALFFDKVLSGNYNISCATCHHPITHTGDGLSLPVGEGGQGLGITRNTGIGYDRIVERVPRNAPPVFNLGARDFDKMFHDGRVFEDSNYASGFYSPAGEQLPLGLSNVLAVQAMFPVTSGTEMTGQAGENEIANAAAQGQLTGDDGVWNLLAERLRDIPEYVELFVSAYPDTIQSPQDIRFVDAANAIAAFEAETWRCDNSPFDHYLRGDQSALSQSQRIGMRLFYGKAGCADCHSGKFQSDQGFHAIAMPQIGPGKGHNSEGYSDGHEDFGLAAITGNIGDRFKFRTPSLRNIALTAPYGHSGSYNDIESVVRHHLDPVYSLYEYDQTQAALPSREDLDSEDYTVMQNSQRTAEIARHNELQPIKLNNEEVAQLIEFLHALTDKTSIDMRNDVPSSVPSGLSIHD